MDAALEIVFSPANLLNAWQSVKLKGRAGGIDDVSIIDFNKNIDDNLKVLQLELVQNRYVPEPYKRIYIEKNDTEFRPIALLTIRDKIAQQAFQNYFRFKLDKVFVNTSYAYRANKSHLKAINRINDFIARKYNFFCSLDIDNYFDTIDRQILLNKCRFLFENEDLLKLIEMWIKTGVIQKGKYVKSTKGIAQGGIISPLLSNIYLHDFDFEMLKKKYDNIRYADNILLLAKDPIELKEKFDFAKNFLQEQLLLGINKVEKEVVTISEGFTFCGIYFKDGKRIIDQKKFQRLIAENRKLLSKGSIFQITPRLNLQLAAIRRYYAPFDTKEQIADFNKSFINLLIQKVRFELENKTIAAPGEAKNLLMNLDFLGCENYQQKKFLINNIVDEVRKNNKVETKPEKSKQDVNRSLEKKRQKYQKVWYSSLDAVISLSFSQIGKSGSKILVRREGKVINEIIANKLKTLLIMGKGVTISSDAVRLCSENNIRIDYFDELGKPFSSIIPAANPVLTINDKQIEALHNNKGKIIAKNIIIAKIKNQISTIKYCIKNRKFPEERKKIYEQEFERMESYIVEISKINLSLDIDEIRGKILGYEGLDGSSFWNMVKILAPDEYEFNEREHKGAKNVINSMFNYAYGVLYAQVLRAVTAVGLNPNISFLHKEQIGKPTLIFDLIEIFRSPIADRAVMAILGKNIKVNIQNGLLNEKTKDVLIKKILTRLNTEIIYKGELRSLNQVIILQAKEITQYLKGEDKIFKPFLSKW